MAMTGWSQITWTAARAGGMTAYVLVTLGVALGLALSLRWQRPAWPRLITNELHRFVTLLSLVFITVHIAAVWVDPYLNFGWTDVFIPLAGHYRPIWTALGIVALYLVLAVWITTQLRSYIGYAWWRRLHGLAFAVYALSTIHGITAGSDTRTPWAVAIYCLALLVVGGLLQLRLLTPIGAHGRTHPNLAAGALVCTLCGLVWALAMPL
jgi:predicted ferric reductase